MFNFIRSIGRSIKTAVAVVAILVLDAAFAVVARFPHHPLNSVLVSRLKMLYLVPTAVLSIGVVAAWKVLVHHLGVVRDIVFAVAGLVWIPVSSVLDTLRFLLFVAYAIVVKVPQFAWSLWTHKPMHPIDFFLMELRKAMSTR